MTPARRRFAGDWAVVRALVAMGEPLPISPTHRLAPAVRCWFSRAPYIEPEPPGRYLRAARRGGAWRARLIESTMVLASLRRTVRPDLP